MRWVATHVGVAELDEDKDVADRHVLEGDVTEGHVDVAHLRGA
jgi:hypothetical protein